MRPGLLAAWVAVLLVLLIACANLAHLTMARALNRGQDIAVRLAFGATNLSAFLTFLFETTLLSIGGGFLGIFVARLVLPVIQHMAKGQVPRLEGLAINVPVLLFSFFSLVAVAILFALPSYLQIFRSHLSDVICSGGSSRGFSVRRSWLSPVLMSSQVAISLTVLLAAIVLLRSFSLTLQTRPGFQPDHVLAVPSTLVDGDWQRSYDLFRNRIQPELERVPGVKQVAAVNAVPMSLGKTEHSRFATRFGIVGRDFEPGRFPTAQTRWSTANYFQVLGIPLIRGVC